MPGATKAPGIFFTIGSVAIKKWRVCLARSVGLIIFAAERIMR